jgi:hypothetical protein
MRSVLLFAVLLAGGLVAWQWRGWPPDKPAPPAPGEPGAGAQVGTGVPEAEDLLSPPAPIEDYASIAERPLFLPDRRPPPDEPEDGPESPPTELSELDGTDLVSVVITPSVVSAWVRKPQERDTIRLRLGDGYEGWTVQSIEPGELVLERQGEVSRLELRDYANAPPPIPPTRLPIKRQRQPDDRDESARNEPDTKTAEEPTPRRPTRRRTSMHGPDAADQRNARKE